MLNICVPINSVSFGFVAYNILVELYKRSIEINLFPIGPVDLSSYPAAKRIVGFEDWLKESIYYAPERFNKHDKTFNLWHITNGSEQSLGVKRNLLTFHELNNITPVEVNSLNNQDTIFVTSKSTHNIIKIDGVKTDVVVVPLGFDNLHFKNLNQRAYTDDRIVFSLFGKLEPARKRHGKVIQNWIKKFGNDRRYQLHLQVFNPHLTPEQNSGLLGQIIGNIPFNVNILPHVKDLDIYNQCLNAADIVMDMGTEGWSIPSFSATAIGKHAVCLNYAGIAEWADKENSVLIEASSMIEPYDNMFFHKGGRTNQGLIADFKDEEFIYGCETAINRFQNNRTNLSGLELQNRFNWKHTVDVILDNLK